MSGSSRQESSSLSPWVVKIGGSIISQREDRPGFNRRNLRSICRFLKELAHPLVVIHGTGRISKSFARSRRILDGKIGAHQGQTVGDCLLMLRQIHFAVLEVLVKQGLHPVSISPFTSCRYADGEIEILRPTLLQELLERGYVPLIHGDLILDEGGDFRICSSDDLAAAVLKQFPADRLLFATDVAGVYPQDPRKFPGGKPLDCLDVRRLERLARLPDDRHDVSGGMPAKLKVVCGVIDRFRECFIFDGRSPEAWHALVNQKKPAGTRICGKGGKKG